MSAIYNVTVQKGRELRELTWKLRVRPNGQQVCFFQAVTSRDAALPPHQVVEDEPTRPPLARRELLKVDSDLKLNVVTYTLDALWRVVLADEILFATFEEPEVSFVNFLKSEQKFIYVT